MIRVFFGMLLAWLCLTNVSVAQEATDPRIERALRVGSVVDRNGKSQGSCFLVDGRGYVATTFTIAQRASDGSISFNGVTKKFSPAGVVAADCGKDIAILALKGFPEKVEPLTLDAKTTTSVNEHVIRWGGPFAEKTKMFVGTIDVKLAPLLPADSTAFPPKIAGKFFGAEYLLGSEGSPALLNGRDPDAEWLWISELRHRSAAGGPVFNGAGNVVAMTTTTGFEGQDVTATAIHAKHIVALMPAAADLPKLKPVSALYKWTDPLPDPKERPKYNEASPDLGGQALRGEPMAVRHQDVQRRVTKAEQSIQELEKLRAKNTERNSQLNVEIGDLSQAIADIRPEEEYTVKEKRTREVRVPDKSDKTGKATKLENEEYEVKVTKFRFSQRQEAMLKPMRDNLLAKRAEFTGNAIAVDFLDKRQQPFITRVRDRLIDGHFYVADPLFLRPRADHEVFVEEVSKTIEAGKAPPILHVTRAMSYATLGDCATARMDLAKVSADPKLSSLAQAVEARCKIVSGQADAGQKQMARCVTTSKNDPRVLMIAARGALDQGDIAQAARYLNLALPTCPDQAEMRLALAWVCVMWPPTATQKALEHAENAVRQSSGYDWSAHAALAGALARQEDYERANVEVELALRWAPESAADMCRTWQSQIKQKAHLTREWK